MSDVFEIATREKYRFCCGLGNISAEDLWSVPLKARNSQATGGRQRVTTLNGIAIALLKELGEVADSVSFVDDPDEAQKEHRATLSNKLEIVKHIIAVKIEERDKAKALADRLSQKKRLLEIIRDKQDQALTELSIEDLEKRIDEL